MLASSGLITPRTQQISLQMPPSRGASWWERAQRDTVFNPEGLGPHLDLFYHQMKNLLTLTHG